MRAYKGWISFAVLCLGAAVGSHLIADMVNAHISRNSIVMLASPGPLKRTESNRMCPLKALSASSQKARDIGSSAENTAQRINHSVRCTHEKLMAMLGQTSKGEEEE